MAKAELKSKQARQGDGSDVPRRVAGDPDNVKSRIRIVPIFITLGTVAVAAFLAWATWQTYMGAPWTRDGTVRAYVVTMAPEVAGRIVELPVADNQLVHKGDLLMVIDPTDYAIAVDQAGAVAAQARANADNAQVEAGRRARLTSLEA